MNLYILNSLIIPIHDSLSKAVILMQKITKEQAANVIQNTPFVSAVGHESTAQLLTSLLGVTIPMNRIAISLKDGDMAIHFVLKERLPEGKVLTLDELQKLQYQFYFSHVIAAY